MNKRSSIFVCVAVAVVIAVLLTVFLVTKNNRNDNTTKVEKITIVKYDENFNASKIVNITNQKQLKELKKICTNVSLEQDDTTPYLAIRNDVKVDLENGIFFMIQLDLSEYCYYEDTNSETKLVIKMPNGLIEKVNAILNENA